MDRDHQTNLYVHYRRAHNTNGTKLYHEYVDIQKQQRRLSKYRTEHQSRQYINQRQTNKMNQS